MTKPYACVKVGGKTCDVSNSHIFLMRELCITIISHLLKNIYCLLKIGWLFIILQESKTGRGNFLSRMVPFVFLADCKSIGFFIR